MAKRKKSKGKRRGGKRKSKGVRRMKAHKPGLAETLGVLKTVYDVEDADTFAWQKAAILHPSRAQFQGALDRTVQGVKDHGGPAIGGIIISNADKLPVVGKMVAPMKRKLDRIAKSYIGMRL
jgi:hypothetical protein